MLNLLIFGASSYFSAFVLGTNVAPFSIFSNDIKTKLTLKVLLLNYHKKWKRLADKKSRTYRSQAPGYNESNSMQWEIFFLSVRHKDTGLIPHPTPINLECI
jgi:hypothetical protein